MVRASRTLTHRRFERPEYRWLGQLVLGAAPFLFATTGCGSDTGSQIQDDSGILTGGSLANGLSFQSVGSALSKTEDSDAAELSAEAKESEEWDAYERESEDQSVSLSSSQRKKLLKKVRQAIAAGGITPLPAAPEVRPALSQLGQALAFDKILSGNRNISCMTCHHSTLETGDARNLPLGEGGSGLGRERTGGHIIPRNAPPLFNLHTFKTMFWDSRVALDSSGQLKTPAGDQLTSEMKHVLEFGVVSAQAMFPITSRDEMRGREDSPADNELRALANDDFAGIWKALMLRLQTEVPAYKPLFEAAYPGVAFEDMSFAYAANAIAGWEIDVFEFRNSRWDRFVAGKDSALNDEQLMGAVSFFEQGCNNCHSGNTFSDFSHQNTGLVQFGPGKGHAPTGTNDLGRGGITGALDDRYAFRVPPLFNVALTGPWGHDGQFEKLSHHVRHYKNPHKKLRHYDMTKEVSDTSLYPLEEDNRQDIEDFISPVAFGMKPDKTIVKFLKALTDKRAKDLLHTIPNSVPSGLPVED